MRHAVQMSHPANEVGPVVRPALSQGHQAYLKLRWRIYWGDVHECLYP